MPFSCYVSVLGYACKVIGFAAFCAYHYYGRLYRIYGNRPFANANRRR